MTVYEKIQEAFRIAGEAFDEVYIEKYGGRLDQMQWPETKLRAIGPMAAEIYRQSNRLIVVSCADEHRDKIADVVRREAENMSPTIILYDADVTITESDAADESILERMRQTLNEDEEKAAKIDTTVANASSTAYIKRVRGPAKPGDCVPIRAFKNTAKVPIEVEMWNSGDYLTVPAQHWITMSGNIYSDEQFNELYEAVKE